MAAATAFAALGHRGVARCAPARRPISSTRSTGSGQPLEQSIKTIRAHFTETTTSSLLVKPVVAEGTLLAVRPSDILLSYSKPEKKLLRIDATTLRFVWPDRKLHETKDIRESQARVQKYFVDKTPDELRQHFAITAAEDAARPGTWRLEMLPKRKQIQQGVTKIELWIDQRSIDALDDDADLRRRRHQDDGVHERRGERADHAGRPRPAVGRLAS